MLNIFETTEYGFAAWVCEVKGCYTEEEIVARGRAKFKVHLHEGQNGTTLFNEWMNSEFYRVDSRVKQMKKATYCG